MMHLRFFFLIGCVSLLTLCPSLAQRGRSSGQNQIGPQEFHLIIRVRESRTYKPLELALVYLKSQSGATAGTAYTDSNGLCEFERVPEGNYRIEVSRDGYRSVQQDSISLGRATLNTQRFDFDLVGAFAPGSTATPPSDSQVSAAELQIPKKARDEFEKGLQAIEKNEPLEKIAQRFRKATEIFPQFDEAYNQWALAYLLVNEDMKARDVLATALDINEKNVTGQTLMGVIQRRQGLMRESILSLAKAVELDATSSRAHFELAQSLLENQDSAQAVVHAQKSRELDASRTEAYIVLFTALIDQRRYDDGLAVLEEFIERFPQDPRIAEVKSQRDQLEQFLKSRSEGQ